MKLPRSIAVTALALSAAAVALFGAARTVPARAGGIASRSYVQRNLATEEGTIAG